MGTGKKFRLEKQKVLQAMSVVIIVAILVTFHVATRPIKDDPGLDSENVTIMSFDHATYEDGDHLKRDSEVVVKGTVQDSGTARQDPSPGLAGDGAPIDGAVRTDFLVEVLDVYKGELSGSNITVIMQGGEINGHRYLASGAPKLEKGDEAVFYLVYDEDQGGYHPLAGGTAIAKPHSRTGNYVLPRDTGADRQIVVRPDAI